MDDPEFPARGPRGTDPDLSTLASLRSLLDNTSRPATALQQMASRHSLSANSFVRIATTLAKLDTALDRLQLAQLPDFAYDLITRAHTHLSDARGRLEQLQAAADSQATSRRRFDKFLRLATTKNAATRILSLCSKALTCAETIMRELPGYRIPRTESPPSSRPRSARSPRTVVHDADVTPLSPPGFDISVPARATVHCGAPVRCLAQHGAVTKLSAAGCEDGSVSIIDMRTGLLKGRFNCHYSPITAIAFSPSGDWFVAGAANGAVTVFDVDSGRVVVRFDKHRESEVIWLCFTTDGLAVMSEDRMGTARVWDAVTGKETGAPLHGKECVIYVEVQKDDIPKIIGACDSSSREWDQRKGMEVAYQGDDAEIRSFTRKHGIYLNCIAWTNGMERCVLGCTDFSLRVQECHTGEVVAILKGHKDAIMCLAMSKDGRRIVSGSEDNCAIVWDVGKRRKSVQTLRGHEGAVTCVAVRADGGQIMTGSNDKTVRIWQVRAI